MSCDNTISYIFPLWRVAGKLKILKSMQQWIDCPISKETSLPAYDLTVNKMQEFTITNQEFIKLMSLSPSYPKHNLNLHGSIKSNILSLLNYLKRWMCIPHPTSPYSNLFKNNNQTSLLNYFHFFLSHKCSRNICKFSS